MSQVNVNYDDQTLTGLDQIASARRLTRPDLLRLIANKAIEAHHGGRLAFAAEEGPRIDSSLNALTAQLKEAVIELDRVQRHNQSVEKKLLDAHVASEANILAAKDEITKRVSDVNSKSYQPFVQKLRQLKAFAAGLAPSVTKSLKPELDEISKKLSALAVIADQPRTQYQLVIGEDRVWTMRFLTLMSLSWGAASIVLFLMFASLVQPMAIGVANRMLHDSPQVCRLIEERFGTSKCEVPVEEQMRDRRIRKLAARQ